MTECETATVAVFAVAGIAVLYLVLSIVGIVIALVRMRHIEKEWF